MSWTTLSPSAPSAAMTSATPPRRSWAVTGDASDDCLMALDADVRSHAAQLRHVGEARLEDVLGDDARAVGRAEVGDHLRLKIRREPRVGQGGEVDGVRPVVDAHLHARNG